MRVFPLLASSFVVTLSAAFPAAAQSSLGLNFAEAAFDVTARDGDTHPAGRLTGDWRITGSHGVQIDLTATDTPAGTLGQVDGHLYLLSSGGAKYGLVASVADMNDRSATIGFAGAEGLFPLSDRTTVEARAGVAVASIHGLDAVVADLGLHHAAGKQLSLSARAQIAAVEESWIDTTAWRAEVSATQGIGGSGAALTLAVGADGLSGDARGGSQGYLRIGFTWRIGEGRSSGTAVAARRFQSLQAFDPLINRGLF